MLAEIFARQLLQFRIRPHVMLARRFVHRFERPRHPSDAAFDSRKSQFRKTLEHSRRAETRDWLDRRRQRMRRIVDDRAAGFARGTRTPPGRDWERARDAAALVPC